MATTRISDVIVAPVFDAYAINRTTELSRLAQSGIIVTDPQLTEFAQGPAAYFDMPHFDDLGDGEANTGSDDPDVRSTPNKIGTGKDQAQQFYRNNSWSSMDLTSALLAKDPMKVIGDLVGGYWARQGLRALLSALKGIVAANVAQDASDMVFDVTVRKQGDATATPTATNLISGDVVVLAQQTMGDASNALTAIAMHSVVNSRLKLQQLIEYRPTAEANVSIPYYLGLEVIVDDTCPVEVVSGKPEYTSFIFGRGAVGYGEGSPKVATEVSRDPAAGNGEGMEVLHNRKHFVQHLRGVRFTRAAMVGVSPTNTELANPANWDRVYSRKKIRFVAVKTNG